MDRSEWVLGDTVEWTSQAQGYARTKRGQIIGIVEPGVRPSRRDFPALYKGAGPGMPRNHASYVVKVGSKLYWPRVSGLAAPPPPAEQASGELPAIWHRLEAAEQSVPDEWRALIRDAKDSVAALSQRPVVLNSENLTGDDLVCISAPAVSGAAFKWDHVETERRKAAFNAWVRTQANKQGFRLMPPGYQGAVHGMLRMAFYAGSNWQRRHGAKAPQQPTGEENSNADR